jgi:hypothetical protein
VGKTITIKVLKNHPVQYMHPLHGGFNFFSVIIILSPFKSKQCTLPLGLPPALRSLSLCAAAIKVGVARWAGSLTLPAVLYIAPLGLVFYIWVSLLAL